MTSDVAPSSEMGISSYLTQPECVCTFMINFFINKNIPAYIPRLPTLEKLIQIQITTYEECVDIHNRNVGRENTGLFSQRETHYDKWIRQNTGWVEKISMLYWPILCATHCPKHWDAAGNIIDNPTKVKLNLYGEICKQVNKHENYRLW